MNNSLFVRRRRGLIIVFTGAAILMAVLSFFRTSVVQAYGAISNSVGYNDMALAIDPDRNGYAGNILTSQPAVRAAGNAGQPMDLAPNANARRGVSMIDVLVRGGIAVAAMFGGFGSVGSPEFGNPAVAASGGCADWGWPDNLKLNDIVIPDDQPVSVWVMETGPPMKTAC